MPFAACELRVRRPRGCAINSQRLRMNPTAIESHLKLVLIQWMGIIGAPWVFGQIGRRLDQLLFLPRDLKAMVGRGARG